MNSKWLINAVLFGAASITTTIIFYLMGPEGFKQFWINPALGVVLLIGLIFIGIKNRKETTEFATYGASLIEVLKIALIGTVIAYGFDVLLFNVIDTGFMEEGKRIVMDNMYERFEGSGMDQDKVDEIMNDTAQRFDDGKTMGGILKGLGFKLGIWTVLSLICAAFVMKKEKEFDGI